MSPGCWSASHKSRRRRGPGRAGAFQSLWQYNISRRLRAFTKPKAHCGTERCEPAPAHVSHASIGLRRGAFVGGTPPRHVHEGAPRLHLSELHSAGIANRFGIDDHRCMGRVFWVSSFFVPLSLCFSTLLNDDETDRHDKSPRTLGSLTFEAVRGGCCCGLPDTVASRPWPRRPAAAGLHRNRRIGGLLSKDDVVQSRPPTTTGLHQHRHE